MSDEEDDIPEIKPVKFNKEECVKQKLIYETKDVMLYSNLYPIKFNEDIDICEYPFKIEPQVHEESIILKIFRELSKELFKIYGYYYRSGPTFFAVKKS